MKDKHPDEQIDMEPDGLPTPRDDERFEVYVDRCLTALKRIPIDLVVPSCLTEQHERMKTFYRRLKRPLLYGPLFENLTRSRIIFFELLYDKAFIAARNYIRV
jgi:hypothetical protein